MFLRRQSRISIEIVILFLTAINFDSKSAQQLPLQSKIISTCSSPRHIWLQQNTVCTTWNQSPSPWEARKLSHLGTLWHQWMVHWSIFRALFMCGMLHSINPQHKNCGHSWIHFYSYPYSQDKFRGLSPPNPIKTKITPIYPHPTLSLVLTPQSPVLSPHPTPVPRVVSDTASVPRVEVPA